MECGKLRYYFLFSIFFEFLLDIEKVIYSENLLEKSFIFILTNICLPDGAKAESFSLEIQKLYLFIHTFVIMTIPKLCYTAP